jgi:hypothetical protein
MLKIKTIMNLIINNLFTILSCIYKLGIKKTSLIYKYMFYTLLCKGLVFAFCMFIFGGENHPLYFLFQKHIATGPEGSNEASLQLMLDFVYEFIPGEWVDALINASPYVLAGGLLVGSLGALY